MPNVGCVYMYLYGAFLCVGHLTHGKHFQHAHLVFYIG
jgi:hypothetical protein